MAAWIQTGCLCTVIYSIDTVVEKKNIGGAGQEAVLSREDTVSVWSLACAAAQIVYLGGRGRGSGFTRAARQTE